MNQERIIAKKMRKDGDFKEALPIYKKLWECNNKENMDAWLGWEYAGTLKKLNMLDDAIAVCKEIYSFDKGFKYNNDLLSWCLYEKYIKGIVNNKRPDDLNHIMKIAKFITNITHQDDLLPYEKTIWKVIKLYKNPFNANVIYEWLCKLDINLLSEDNLSMEKDKKTIELASKKEEWYYLKCKCLNELCKYKECIELCDLTISKVKKFHNDRAYWIEKEKAECIAKLGEKDKSINILKKMLIRKEHWSVYDKIFQLQVELKNYDEGLKYAYSAALTKDPEKGKINLYFEIGNVLELQKKFKYALLHYVLSKKIREENNWKIPSNLNDSIDRLRNVESISSEKVHSTLKAYWIDEKINYSERYNGIILRLLPNGKAGFIKSENDTYYFSIYSIIKNRNQIKENTNITFSLSDSYDKKKDRKTKEAIDILFI